MIMKFIVSVILMAFLSFALCLYLPWWSIAIACFAIAACIRQRNGAAFLAGFTALFFLWGGLTLWLSSNNGHVLSRKISMVLIQSENPAMLVIITAAIGALVAAFAALAGSQFRYLISKH